MNNNTKKKVQWVNFEYKLLEKINVKRITERSKITDRHTQREKWKKANHEPKAIHLRWGERVCRCYCTWLQWEKRWLPLSQWAWHQTPPPGVPQIQLPVNSFDFSDIFLVILILYFSYRHRIKISLIFWEEYINTPWEKKNSLGIINGLQVKIQNYLTGWTGDPFKKKKSVFMSTHVWFYFPEFFCNL